MSRILLGLAVRVTALLASTILMCTLLASSAHASPETAKPTICAIRTL